MTMVEVVLHVCVDVASKIRQTLFQYNSSALQKNISDFSSDKFALLRRKATFTHSSDKYFFFIFIVIQNCVSVNRE